MENEVKKNSFLKDGDVVKSNKVDDCPEMIVKELIREKGASREIFKGVVCYWFDKNHSYQEKIFHAKDLELIK